MTDNIVRYSFAFHETKTLHDLRLADIGFFNAEGSLDVLYDNKQIAGLSLEFLHDGVPRKTLLAEYVKPVAQEPALPAETDAGFRFRYRGLRLLIQGEGQMFLVPDRWSPSNSTLVVPMDGTVRVQFRFVNQAP